MRSTYIHRSSREQAECRSEPMVRRCFCYPAVSTARLQDTWYPLENRIIDLTTLRTPIAMNGCETKPLLKESLMAMSIPDSPLLQERSSIPLKELSRQPLILSYRYRKYMLAAFERAGLMCDIYFTCGDARTAMTMAEKGLGIAILPASMQTLSSKLTSCRISGADLTTEILLLRHFPVPDIFSSYHCEVGKWKNL